MNRCDVRTFGYWFICATLGLVVSFTTFAQGTEQEANNTCQSAQDFGANSLPFIVDGTINPSDALPGAPGDVDFYRFAITPGTTVRVDLKGSPTGNGTLSDPFLGSFDSTCNLVAISDDYTTLNSRLVITVPDDGIVVLAVQGCCDASFQGSGEGTYQLTLSQFLAIGSIQGQLVDAASGSWPSSAYTFVNLFSCQDPQDQNTCFLANSSGVDSNGIFLFTQDFYGQPLEVGNYLLEVYALGYQPSPFRSDLFFVNEGQAYDHGTIQLTPLPSIGSISGRAVDAYTNVPLSGQDFPFSSAALNWCDISNYCYQIKNGSVDGSGNFVFLSDYPGELPPGNYEVVVTASDYQEGRQIVLDVQEGENRNIGDIPLEPNPIHFSDIRPCGNLPETGGTCNYSVRITNRSRNLLSGAAWSLVSSFGTGSMLGTTNFQTANPVKMTLSPGKSRVVNFQFDVPANVANGAYMCANVYVGGGGHQYFFNTLAGTNLLCIEKVNTGFSLLSKKEANKLSKKFYPSPRVRTGNGDNAKK